MDRTERDRLKAMQQELDQKWEEYHTKLREVTSSALKMSAPERDSAVAELTSRKQEIDRLQRVIMVTLDGNVKVAQEKYEEMLAKDKSKTQSPALEPTRRLITCPKCKGAGQKQSRWRTEKCTLCNGTGKEMTTQRRCTACDGHRFVGKWESCSKCYGKGTIEEFS